MILFDQQIEFLTIFKLVIIGYENYIVHLYASISVILYFVAIWNSS